MTAAASAAFRAYQTADANPRWMVTGAGDVWWGDGTAAQDTHVYRTGAGVLRINETLNCNTSLQVAGTKVLGAQGAAVADAAVQDIAGANTVDENKVEADLLSCKTAINLIIARLEAHGIIAA